MDWLNSSYSRQPILDYLQEPEDDDLEYKRPVEKGLCCNACNNDLHRVPAVPAREKENDKPTETSVAGVAAKLLSDWCSQRAQDLVSGEARLYDLAGEWWMDENLQYEVARSFIVRPDFPTAPGSNNPTPTCPRKERAEAEEDLSPDDT
ncbi:hypothetical protein CONLIGDRAFT_324738 [Coniochaeta ligniaria NRRL 30616]|uniref:Uncharacterized protein n=1 Tax=Coniochaeta ligniaria NRRL 30616 TaxID=1408157 RepID=A0A1J7IP64_9PEZI|nr:hypothetical protein CONLIGDRAFT_324738 [Coniochaeta ligniaria NRRL 30616]